jgi:hypothetical protein
MEIIIDGDRGFAPQGDPPDALAMAAAITEFLRERGRGIVSLKVNDRNIHPQALVEELEGLPLEQVNAIEVESRDLGSMVDDVLAQIRPAVEELPSMCHQLATVFQGDKPEEGYEPFEKLAEVWGHVKGREAQIAQALQLDVAATQLDDKSLQQVHEELNQYLLEAAEALQAQDVILLGDLLEYELAPRAELETQIVSLLEERARQTS